MSAGPYTYTYTRTNNQPNHMSLEYGASRQLGDVDITALYVHDAEIRSKILIKMNCFESIKSNILRSIGKAFAKN
jgi:hypothetical protein